MPKKLFAVTNIKIGPGDEGWFAAGSEVDSSKFTKEQLLQLHDQGAVEVRVVEDEEKVTEPQQTDEPVVTETPTTDPANEIAPGEDPQARVEEANSTDANVNTDAMSNAPDPDSTAETPTADEESTN